MIDKRLRTTEYKGFEARKMTLAITVHFTSMGDVKKRCLITGIRLNHEEFVPDLAYFALGPNPHRCAVYGLDRAGSSERVVKNLLSSTETVLAARSMGKTITFIMTVQGTQLLPELFY